MYIELPQTVQKAIDRLESFGYEAYAVGGCVRDSILGRTPNDWDITTSARPEQTAAVFCDARTVETGVQHGTLTVILDGMPLEITTYRRDGAYADNRHPEQVTFSSCIEDDLCRRDFTVNAMAYHPVRGLVDLYGGQEDLARGVISCVGDAKTRFCEDGLRILRAVRFASVLDFSVEENTALAVHACSGLLKNIAAERIREELCKLILGKGAVRILRAYADVIAQPIPELYACVGFAQNTKYHCYDVYEHSLHALEANAGTDLVTRLSILLHDIGKPLTYTEDEQGGHFKGHGDVGVKLTGDILRRLRFDNATAEAVIQLVAYHDRPLAAERRAVKRLMQKMTDENLMRLLELQRCDRVAHAAGFATPPEVLAEIPRLMRELREEDACLSLKTLAIKGNDLMALGVPAGKQMGRLLQLLLDEVVEERLPNEREALLSAAREWLRQTGS